MAGIETVYQTLALSPALSIVDNMFLGREIRKGALGLLDLRAMREAARPLLARVGAGFRPETPVADLSLAERQLLEIAKALSIDARVVIMDEPTSSLTLSETQTLMRVIAGMYPPAEWSDGDVMRGLAGFWLLLIAPVVGAVLGAITGRGG